MHKYTHTYEDDRDTKCLDRADLNKEGSEMDVIHEGRLFQSMMARGKNECIKESVCPEKGWHLRGLSRWLLM